MENNKDKNKDNNDEFIQKIDLDNNNDKNNIIKTVKNLINSNNKNSKRIIDVKESDEKNKEDENKNINKNESNKDEINKNNNIQNNIEENIKTNNNQEILEEEKNNEDDPVLSHMNSNIIINDEEITNASKIILEEINGNLLNGQKIEINAAGMVGGRNKKDGYTIFGQKFLNLTKNSSEDSDNEDSKEKNENQYLLDFELNYAQYLSYPYIFAIYYKKEEKSFYIKGFSGKGSDNKVLFIKLNNKNKFILNQKELILTGNIIFQVKVNDNFIEITNLSKNPNNNKYIIDGFNKKIITIGRHKDCDFSFPKDKSFSRYQTTIEFNEEAKKWTIMDGYNDKESTNGTWIFGTHSFLIKDEMIVEILNCQIKIIEIKNQNFSE